MCWRRAVIAAPAVVLLLGMNAPAGAGFDDAVAAYKRGDYAAAAAEFERLAAAGDPFAMNNLGLMYGRGQGVPQDFAAARAWYVKAVDRGHAGAMNNLGVMYERGQGAVKDYATAAEWYRRAAAMGDGNAQFNLAALYEKGQGVGQDLVQAYMWYGLAVARGVADAAKARDKLKTVMTDDQLALAENKLANWEPRR